MESQPQNPEFRNNPENFHQCIAMYANLQASYVQNFIQLCTYFTTTQLPGYQISSS